MKTRALSPIALAALLAACSSSDPTATADAGSPALEDAGTTAPDGASSHDSAAAADAAAYDAQSSPDAADGATTSGPPARQSLIWVWQDYANSIAAVASHASSFTHVSPALYQLNYDYASGVATQVNTDDDYDGLSSQQVAQQIHAAGLLCVPLMYAGSGNYGTDQGLQNVMNDSPAGAQASFISSMVAEAMTKGYDGYNLDWEVDNTGYAQYGAKYVAFLTAFKTALNAHQMTLSVDVAGWYTLQCSGSGGDGLADLTQLGAAVDLAIIEDYAGSFDDNATSCPATNPSQEDCDSDFGGGLSVMCNLPKNVVSIGLISTGTNSFVDQALAGITSYGYTNVATWPDDAQFLNPSGIPNGGTWYTVLDGFLHP
jgi:hypothetical protein